MSNNGSFSNEASDTFVFDGGETAGENGFADQRERLAFVERRNGSPFSGAFLPSGVENEIDDFFMIHSPDLPDRTKGRDRVVSLSKKVRPPQVYYKASSVCPICRVSMSPVQTLTSDPTSLT